MRPVVVAVVLLALSGCNSSSDDPVEKPDPLHTYNGRVIRGWLLSLERQDYEQAAYYFAPNALIDQGRPYRLRTKSDAFAFNAGLPCRADLIRLKGGGHAHHVLATFRLVHDSEGEVHRVAAAPGRAERAGGLNDGIEGEVGQPRPTAILPECCCATPIQDRRRTAADRHASG